MRSADLHCDTFAALHSGMIQGTLAVNNGQVDLAKLEKGEVGLQCFALYVDREQVASPYRYARELLDLAHRELTANAEQIALIRSAEDWTENERQGKLSALLTIEEGGVLEGRRERLDEFYQEGVRLMTLTWNYPNELGYPNHGYRYADCGLTEFGREIVSSMQAMGMLVDVSHLSDRGFYDVAEMAVRPFLASHSNARSITEHPRNLTDEMIRVLAEKGGVVGLNFANLFLGDSSISRAEDMVRHALHIRKVGGIECLAVGSDFDGIDPQVEIADASEMVKLWQALGPAGYTELEIELLRRGNVKRLLRDGLNKS